MGVVHVIYIQFVQCLNMYTVCQSEESFDVVEALSSKRPSQEDGSEHEGSDHDDETDSSKNNPRGSQVLNTALVANTLSSRP